MIIIDINLHKYIINEPVAVPDGRPSFPAGVTEVGPTTLPLQCCESVP